MKKIVVLIVCLFALLINKTNAQITIEDGQVAPDFANFKGTLLVVVCTAFKDNTLNDMTEKRFKKHYTGDFEMITEEDLISKPDSDPKKYRYTVQLQNSRTVSRGAGGGAATDATKFVMTDRVTNTKYETKSYSNWVAAMNQYPKALEKVRSKL